MKRVVIIMKTLRVEGEGVAAFHAELQKLTPQDVIELSDLGAKLLNVTVED